jgi:hypothetical protein
MAIGSRQILLFLLALAVAMTAIGGYLDFSGEKRAFGISKKHAWNDGTFLVLLVIALALLRV